jgi:hypothetical protein
MKTTRLLLAAAAASLALAATAPVASSAGYPDATFVVEKVTATSTHTWNMPRTQVSGPKGLKDPICMSGGTFLSGSGTQTVTFKTKGTARFKLYWLPGLGATGALSTKVGGVVGDQKVTRAGRIVQEVVPGTGEACEGSTPTTEELEGPYDCGEDAQESSVGLMYTAGRVKLYQGLVLPVTPFQACPILTGPKADDTRLGGWVQSARKVPMARLFNRNVKRHVIAAKLVQTFRGEHLGAPWTGRTVTEWTVVLKRVG